MEVRLVQTGFLLVQVTADYRFLVNVNRTAHAARAVVSSELSSRATSCSGQGIGNVFSIRNTITLKAVWDSWITSVDRDEKRGLYCKDSLRWQQVFDT